MYGQNETLAEAAQLIEDRFAVDGYDPEIKEWAAAQLDTVQEDLDLVIRGDEGYENWLTTFIGREHERERLHRQGARPEATPYDTLRKTPLCTCGDLGCDLKKGRLPITIRSSTDIGAGIQEFHRVHAGDPIVLDHDDDPRGARQEWSAKRRRVWRVIRRVRTFMVKSRDEPPTDDELSDGPGPGVIA